SWTLNFVSPRGKLSQHRRSTDSRSLAPDDGLHSTVLPKVRRSPSAVYRCRAIAERVLAFSGFGPLRVPLGRCGFCGCRSAGTWDETLRAPGSARSPDTDVLQHIGIKDIAQPLIQRAHVTRSRNDLCDRFRY